MKVFALLASCFILFSGIAFAENAPDNPQNNKDGQATNQSKYKSSPRLKYHSDKSADKDNNLEGLKPILNQVLGNDQKNSPGGVEIPSGPQYNF